jgi:hypothetical protein
VTIPLAKDALIDATQKELKGSGPAAACSTSPRTGPSCRGCNSERIESADLHPLHEAEPDVPDATQKELKDVSVFSRMGWTVNDDATQKELKVYDDKVGLAKDATLMQLRKN